MKYLKLFNTTQEYDTAESNLILPNVSLCKDAPTVVYYSQYDPYNGHEYVDLGLPSGTMWAKMNVGASSETDYGNYYQYGKGSAQYAATSGQSDYAGTENPIARSADTAAQVMGGEWHMPTEAQTSELFTYTTYEQTTINGIKGGKFTATNGNYIFLPEAGNWARVGKLNVGSIGNYWTASPYNSSYAYRLCVTNSRSTNSTDRNLGFSIRGVVG